MTSILVTGYRSFELGIFKDKDPKIAVIKKAIKRAILGYCDQGLDWLIFTVWISDGCHLSLSNSWSELEGSQSGKASSL